MRVAVNRATLEVAIDRTPMVVPVSRDPLQVVTLDPPASPSAAGYEFVTRTVDAVSRHMGVRDPGGTITDVVVWCPGLGHTGPDLLVRIPPAAGRADIAPTALYTRAAGPGWVIPGLPPSNNLYPPGAPSDTTDLHFLEDVVDYAQGRWGNGVRLWLAGASKGGLLTWAALAYNQTYDLPFLAHYVSCGGMPRADVYGWSPQSRAGLYIRKPVALRHGSATSDTVSQDDAGAQSWADSVAGLLTISGHTVWGSSTSVGVCCGQALTVRIGLTGGTVRAREYNHSEAPHGWQDCPSHPTSPCDESVRCAIPWFGVVLGHGLGT